MARPAPLRLPADRSLAVRAATVVAGAALAVAGCGAVMPGAVVDGAADGDAATAVPGGSVATGPVPGVTADTVTVVFVGVDLQGVSEITGFRTADAGDPAAQVEALESWVNANGGIAGRELDAVFRLYDASTDSPATEEQLCNQITQDDRAFAVVLTGQFQSNARPCYAQRETLVLDATLVATDAATYAELSPFLVSASYPAYDGFVRALITTLTEQAFFDGRDRVGVVAADNPVNRTTVEELAVPLLAESGITADIAWVDTTDQGSLFQGADQGAVQFRTAGIDRVMFLGGARLASIFATVATAQSFTARYAISSFDNPSFFINNPQTIDPAVLDGMVGVGFNPSQDVPDSQLPFPSSDAERRCLEAYGAAGISFDSREAARVALPYCDATLLLQAAARDLGDDLDAGAWVAAAQQLGSAFVPATGFSGALGADRFAASGAYRVLAYDAACGCFAYQGSDVPFPVE